MESTAHLKVAGSFAVNAVVGVLSFVGVNGRSVYDKTGFILSFVHVYVAGVGSDTPKLSLAVTSNVFTPLLTSDQVNGEVHAEAVVAADVEPGFINLQLKVEPGTVLVNVKTAFVRLDGSEGLETIVVSGGGANVIELDEPATKASTCGVVIGFAPVWTADLKIASVPTVPVTPAGAII